MAWLERKRLYDYEVERMPEQERLLGTMPTDEYLSEVLNPFRYMMGRAFPQREWLTWDAALEKGKDELELEVMLQRCPVGFLYPPGSPERQHAEKIEQEKRARAQRRAKLAQEKQLEMVPA